MNTLDIAKAWFDKGRHPIPLRFQGKEPLCGFKEGPPTWETIAAVTKESQFNLGLLLDGIVVVDIDGPAGREYADNNFVQTAVVCKTGSGGEHRYYSTEEDLSGRIKLEGFPLDIKTGIRSYAVIPDSIHPNGKPYEWIKTDGKMTEFESEWLPAKPTIDTSIATEEKNDYVVWIMTRGYVGKIEGAVSGQAGHSKTFYVACKIRDRLAGIFTAEECLPIMQEYNQRCDPPWSDAELLHKLRSAFEVGTRP